MDNLEAYVDFLMGKAKLQENLKVVFDCSNGTTGMVIEKLKIKSLKSKVINQRPDGNFPAHGPNPLAPGAMEDLRNEVKKSGADLGAIFDADGDRAFFVDDLGREVPADAVLYLLGKNFTGPVVANVLAGYLAADLFKKEGKNIIEVRVGHYFMKKAMKAGNAEFGGEFSGHYYFPLGDSYFDSGILSAVHLINEVSVMKALGQKLSDWIDSLPVYYRSGELNFEVREKEAAMAAVEAKYQKLAEKVSKMDGLKMSFADWWFVLRPSNTEDLLRLVVEAKSEALLKENIAVLTGLLK